MIRIDPKIFQGKYAVDLSTGCWLWLKGRNNSGYGVTRVVGVNERSTHRLSYICFKSDIPSGLYILHKCDVRHCINPDHLYLGNHQDNMNDMNKKKRNKNCGKLTDEQVKEIAFSVKTTKFLVEKYNVSTVLINCIKRGKYRKHVIFDSE